MSKWHISMRSTLAGQAIDVDCCEGKDKAKAAVFFRSPKAVVVDDRDDFVLVIGKEGHYTLHRLQRWHLSRVFEHTVESMGEFTSKEDAMYDVRRLSPNAEIVEERDNYAQLSDREYCYLLHKIEE